MLKGESDNGSNLTRDIMAIFGIGRVSDESRNALLTEFNRFRRELSCTLPLTEDDHEKCMEEQGRILKEFVDGGSFEDYLTRLKNLFGRYPVFERMFLVETEAELFEILSHLHADNNSEGYAITSVLHERNHEQQALGVTGVESPDILFGIILFSDERYLPCTVFGRNMSGYSLIQSHKKNPYYVFEKWGEGSRTFWQYMIKITDDKSKGDSLILG